MFVAMCSCEPLTCGKLQQVERREPDHSMHEYYPVHCLHGLLIPRPPRRTGRAKKSLISSLHGFWPVSEGMSLVLIFSSSVLNIFSVSGMVLVRKFLLFIKPCVNAVYRLHVVEMSLLRIGVPLLVPI